MLTASQILWGFVIPALLVLAALLASWRPWDKQCTLNGRWIAAPAVGAAFCIAFWNLQQRPAWPPGSGGILTWIFYFAIVLGIAGLLESIFCPPRWLMLILILFLWRLAVRILIGPIIPRIISPTAAEMWIDAAALVATAFWLAMDTLAHRAPGVTVPLIMGIVCAGTAVTLVTWHILISGMLAGVVAVFCAATFVVSLWNKRVSLSQGAITAMVLLLLSVVVHAYFYTPDTFTNSQNALIVLLLLSPLLAFAGDLPGIRDWRPGPRLFIRIIPVLLAVGTVAGLGLRSYLAQPPPGQDSGMEE